MHHRMQAEPIAGGADFPWLIVGLIALTALIGLIIWLVVRGGEASDQGHPSEREIEENLDGQILAMLHQAGGSMLQTEIAANLGLPAQRVATALRKLTDSGRVTRKWEAGRYTYRVIHRHAQEHST
jgi:uncharacterized membrane protein